ncbi:MAG: DUF2934 domain-containing protein [Rhodocyclaceae bacterium]|jgi:hypothetical protein|nr:DUF2934 domain-containing protein [Rhodocyclaceae bacterium]
MGKNNSAGKTKTGEQPQQASQASDAAAIPREQLISEAAYYKAEQRGFQPGNEMADWFEAEADVDSMLGNSSATGGL